MAGLLRHERDMVAVCRAVCGKLVEQRFDYEDVVEDESGRIGSAAAYTCSHCGGSYHRDFQPMPGLTHDDVGRVLDRREWATLRNARLGTTTVQGIAPPAARSAPGPTSRGVLPVHAGRYSFVREVR